MEWILFCIIICLLFYSYHIRKQIIHIDSQLEKRLQENYRAEIKIELFSRDLNRLVEHINETMRREEEERLKGIREEKKFRDLIADLSHDLRTPLTAIRGYQQLIGKEALTDTQWKRLEVAMRHADELGEMIDLFFEYAYLLSDTEQAELEKVNLTDLVLQCLADAVPSIEEKGIWISFEETKDLMIMGNQDKCVRMVQNLIRNCLQHSAGKVGVELTGEDIVSLTFSNAAPNLRPEDGERIFDRFYSKDKARGWNTGLGLSIVKVLVTQMGGSCYGKVEDGILSVTVAFTGEANRSQHKTSG